MPVFLVDRFPLEFSMTRNKISTAWAVMVAIMLTVPATSAQTHPEQVMVNLCEVLSLPAEYNHKVISVEGVLFPSIHSLFLFSMECNRKDNPDSTTQAVLPDSWETLPKGKELRKFLHRGKSATVKLTGTFEADPQRYGPDGARFRFVISGISSVVAAPTDFHP
jgi:hypothetical protein